MLGETFRAIVVHIHGDRVKEVLLDDSSVDHRCFKALLDPFGALTYVLAHTCSHMAERLAELFSSPHVAIAEEKFSPHEPPLVHSWVGSVLSLSIKRLLGSHG